MGPPARVSCFPLVPLLLPGGADAGALFLFAGCTEAAVEVDPPCDPGACSSFAHPALPEGTRLIAAVAADSGVFTKALLFCAPFLQPEVS